MSKKNTKAKAEGKNVKKSATGKTVADKKKSSGVGKTAPGNKSSSGRATQPAKRTPTKQEQLSLIKRVIDALKNQRKILKRKNSSARDEYRYNIETGHVNYVYLVEKDGDKETYHSLGFTHHDTYDGVKNMPLAKNPKKGDNDKSYIRNGEIVAERKAYSRKKAKNYQLIGDDKANAKSKIRHHKKEKKKKAQKKIE